MDDDFINSLMVFLKLDLNSIFSFSFTKINNVELSQVGKHSIIVYKSHAYFTQTISIFNNRAIFIDLSSREERIDFIIEE